MASDFDSHGSQRRSELASQAGAILDEAQNAGRDMTAEEEQKFDRLMDDADGLERQIERAGRLAKTEADLDRTVTPARAPAAANTTRTATATRRCAHSAPTSRAAAPR